MITRRHALAAPALLLPSGALAQSWPDRPIRLVVAFPAGSVTDTLMRHLAEPLGRELGQPVIVDNRPGGNGVVGTEGAARSPADGHTWCVLSVTNGALAPYTVRRLPYDPLRDFTPVGFVAENGYILVVPANSPARDLAGLLAMAKERPGRLTFSHGNSAALIASATLARMAGTEMTAVPYRGGAEALTDVVAGRIDSTWTDFPAGLPQIREGKVRALAVTLPQRSPLAPEIPAAAEALPGYGFTFWFGMAVPAATPAPVVARANAAMNKVLAMPAFAERIAGMGFVPRPAPPEAFRTFLSDEIRTYAQRAREAGIEPG